MSKEVLAQAGNVKLTSVPVEGGVTYEILRGAEVVYEGDVFLDSYFEYMSLTGWKYPEPK